VLGVPRDQVGERPDLGRMEVGAAADLVAWDAEHEGAFALRLGAMRPVRAWVGGEEIALTA
jgi:imidazolonepropionase-like amidohydrolase